MSIDSPMNACCYREQCLANEHRIRELEAELERLRGPIRTAECIDWGLTAAEIGAQFRAVVLENQRLRWILFSSPSPRPPAVPPAHESADPAPR